MDHERVLSWNENFTHSQVKYRKVDGPFDGIANIYGGVTYIGCDISN